MGNPHLSMDSVIELGLKLSGVNESIRKVQISSRMTRDWWSSGD